MSHVRNEVPRGGHGGDDTGEEHRRHVRLRLPPRVQQHRGDDLAVGALSPSDSEHQQSHQGRPDRAGHGPPRRRRERVRQSQQAEGFRGGHTGLRGQVQQEQASSLRYATCC